MASNKFPGPNINRLIDDDPMIVKVDIDKGESVGMRSSSMPKNIKNNMTLSHIGKDSGPGRNNKQ